MAILRASEIQKIPKSELETKERELRKELMKLSAQKSTGTLASPGKLKAIKRAIAMIHTVKSKA